MPSFSIPLSGLDAASTSLSVIADNLSNLNTVGFKSQSTQFQDLFYQQIGTSGNGNLIQEGVGVAVGAISSDLTQGSIQSSGVATDVAIQGHGYFVVDQGGERVYTRAGAFSVSPTGQLLTQQGGLVLGSPSINGVVNPNAALAPLIISSGTTNPPKPTTTVQLSMNLNSGSALPVSAASQQTGTGILPAAVLTTGSVLTISDDVTPFTYTTVLNDTLATVAAQINTTTNFTASITGNSLVIADKNGAPVTFTANTLRDAAANVETFAPSATVTPAGTFSTSVTVFDSLGAPQVLSYNFTKTGPNAWSYAITIPAANGTVTGGTGNLTFNGAGQLIAPSTNVAGISIALTNGANPLPITWDLFNPNGGGGLVTQLAAASATSSTQQDGFSSGTLVNYTITGDGTIQGTFSNGETSALGQIELASFTNEQGLVRNGSNEYLSSLSSGQANVGTPGTGGRGTLSGGALEQSNVDIATQFAQLIVAERGYQANAKSVTTFDTVTQTAIGLIP
jgi:flagellar hook protein FlgE